MVLGASKQLTEIGSTHTCTGFRSVQHDRSRLQKKINSSEIVSLGEHQTC